LLIIGERGIRYATLIRKKKALVLRREKTGREEAKTFKREKNR